MGRYTLDKRAVLGSKPRVGTKHMNNAIINGYSVQFMDTYSATWIDVAEGIRGFNVPVTVFKDTKNNYTVALNGKKLTVLSVTKVDRPKI